jgi:hypothetical protein
MTVWRIWHDFCLIMLNYKAKTYVEKALTQLSVTQL